MLNKLLRRSVNIIPRYLPDTMACPACHWEMHLVSIDLGYSCRNPQCRLHVEKEVLA